MTFRIQYTNDLSALDGVKCLGYGRSGVGKTRLIATAPRPFIISAEKGLLSLRNIRVPFNQIGSLKELQDARDWAQRSHEAKNYDTIGLDSVSEIAEGVLYEEQQANRDPRKSYPLYQAKMMEVFRDFRDLPRKHVYFIAKEESVEQTMGVKTAVPSFPGNKLPEAAPYFFDQVFRVMTGTNPQDGSKWEALKCQRDIDTEGKDRSGTLNLWEPFNLSAMFIKIMQGRPAG